MVGRVARQTFESLMPGGAAKVLQQALQGRLFQRGLEAHQQVTLFGERHEAQAFLPGRVLGAQPHIGAAAQHRLRHRRVRRLHVRKTSDVLGHQAGLRQQFFEQQPGAGADGAVDETRLQPRHIGHGLKPQGIAGRHHQALRAARKTDDLVQARPQQRPVSARAQAAGCRKRLCVKACESAAPFIECANGVHAATEADVQVQRCGGAVVGDGRCSELLQLGQRMVVAGVERDHVAGTGARGVVERHRERALQLGTQAFHLRSQPGLRQPFGHQQALAKGREPRGLAAFPEDQSLPQLGFPVLQLPPHVAVRKVQLARRAGNRATAAQGVQHIHHRVAQQGGALRSPGPRRGQGVGELDLSHGGEVCPKPGGRPSKQAYVRCFIPRHYVLPIREHARKLGRNL